MELSTDHTRTGEGRGRERERERKEEKEQRRGKKREKDVWIFSVGQGICLEFLVVRLAEPVGY
jgi:hypothetical protein